MLLLCVMMIIIRLLIVIIYKRPLDAYNGFMLIFDKLEQRLLLSMKGSHFRTLINFCLLDVIKRLKPSTINCATHLTSNPRQSSLQLQTPISGLSITCDIPQKIAFQKHGRVVMS